MHRIVFFALFILLSATSIQAQSTTSISTPEIINNLNLIESIDDNWSFYVDDQNQIYFIDFETINVNLSDIIVKNDRGEVIMKEDVLDLPVNTIFEIDFSEFGPGSYQVELRSFTGMIKKEVSIR